MRHPSQGVRSGALVGCMLVEKPQFAGGDLPAFPTAEASIATLERANSAGSTSVGTTSYRNSTASRLMTGVLSQLEDQLIQLGNSLPRNLSSFSGPIDPPFLAILAAPLDGGLHECELAFVDRALLLAPSNQRLDQRVHFFPTG